MTPNILDWADYPTQDRLYELKWDVFDGIRNEGLPPQDNYNFWQTCSEGRNRSETPWLVSLCVDLAVIGAQYFCQEDNDSLGDWLAAHGFLDQEAA